MVLFVILGIAYAVAIKLKAYPIAFYVALLPAVTGCLNVIGDVFRGQSDGEMVLIAVLGVGASKYAWDLGHKKDES